MRPSRGTAGNRRPRFHGLLARVLLILVRGEGHTVGRGRTPAQGHLGIARLRCQAAGRPRRGHRHRRHGPGRRAGTHAVHRAHLEGIGGAIGQARHRVGRGLRLPRGTAGNRRPGPRRPAARLLLILVRGNGRAVGRGRAPAQGHLGIPRLRRHAPRRPRHGRRGGRHGRGRRAGAVVVHRAHLKGIRGAIGQARHRVGRRMGLPRGTVGNRRPGPIGAAARLLLILVRGEGHTVVRGRTPAQGHLGIPRLRREARQQRRHGPLIAEFLPRRGLVAVDVYLQHRIVAGRAEVPGVIPPGGQGVIAVGIVQVHIPGEVDPRIGGGRLQLAGRLARPSGTRGPPRALGIPIARRDRAVVVDPHQAPHLVLPRHPARGIGGRDGAVVVEPHQAPHLVPPPHPARGIAGGDAAPVVVPHQAAYVVPCPRHRTRGIARGDGTAVVVPHQAPHKVELRPRHRPRGIAARDRAAVVVPHQAPHVVVLPPHRPRG